MGANSKKLSGADAGGNLLYFSPEKLILVTDEKHPLYDERVHLPLSERLVLNIMKYGVIEPIVVRNNGRDESGQPIVEVVVGRQRVKCCIEANKRLTAEGKEPHRVPATTKRAEAATLMGVMISENEIREADSPLFRARKLAAFLDTGKTEEEAAITFGVTMQTIRNMLKVLELHPTVQKAIDNGLPVNVAKELSAVPQEEQPAALEKLVASGNIKGAKGVEAARNLRKQREPATSTVRMMSRTAIEEWVKALKKEDSGQQVDLALAVLNRVLGKERSLANYPKVREPLKATESEK